jgi:hypothetical protein
MSRVCACAPGAPRAAFSVYVVWIVFCVPGDVVCVIATRLQSVSEGCDFESAHFDNHRFFPLRATSVCTFRKTQCAVPIGAMVQMKCRVI